MLSCMFSISCSLNCLCSCRVLHSLWVTDRSEWDFRFVILQNPSKNPQWVTDPTPQIPPHSMDFGFWFFKTNRKEEEMNQSKQSKKFKSNLTNRERAKYVIY